MSQSGLEERSGSGLPNVVARAAAGLLMLVAVLLAGLVVLGMATGTHRHFDNIEAYPSAVVAVQVLGVISLLSLGGVARACIGVWQGHRPRIIRWTVLAIPVWLIWALVRIGEYAT